jgi:iron complex outermembrane receptor protein
MNSAKTGVLLVVVLVLTMSQVLKAQESSAQTAGKQPAAAAGSQNETSGQLILKEVVVTAQKRTQNLQNVPIMVSVLTATQLSRGQVTLVSDLVQQTPTLNVSERGVGTSLDFSIRGIGALAPGPGVQPAVGLVIDGVPLERTVEYNMEMADVQSVQVLSGPQGTLFGENTMGGVIDVTTKQPTSTFEGSVEASATSDQDYSVDAAVSGPLSDHVRGRIFIYGDDETGYIDNLYPGMHPAGGDETRGGIAQLDMDVTGDLNVDLFLDYRHQHTSPATEIDGANPAIPQYLTDLGNGNPTLGQRIVNDPGLINSDFNQYLNVVNEGVSLQPTWHVSDALSLKSISSFRETIENNSIDVDDSPATASNPGGLPIVSVDESIESWNGKIESVPADSSDAPRYFTQEVRMEYHTKRIDGIVGAFYSHVDESVGGLGDRPNSSTALIENNGAKFNDGLYRAELTNFSEAAFGDLTWHVTNTVDVFGGYRFTHESLTNDLQNDNYSIPSSEFTTSANTVIVDPGVLPTSVKAFDASTEDNEWSGRAGAMWHITPDVAVYFSASRGITGAGAVAKSAATLKTAFVFPSIAGSYEIGAKTELFEHRLRLNMSLFKMKVGNLQQEYFDAVTGESVEENAGNLDDKGLEADATALLGERLTLAAGVALLDTRMYGNITQNCYYGQTAEEGCVTYPNGTTAQSENGKPDLFAPKTKFTIRPTYDLPLPSMPFDGFVSLAYVWQSKVAFEPLYDPSASYQGSYGLLDVALGITDKEGKYEVSLFGKNVLDKHYILFSQSEYGRDALSRGYYPQDAFAYWGVKATYRF